MAGFNSAMENLFKQKVNKGLAELDQEKGISHEEVKKRIKKMKK
jgi:hypothetical protein